MTIAKYATMSQTENAVNLSKQTKDQLIGNITGTAGQLTRLQGDILEFKKTEVGLGNVMLDVYQILLTKHDMVPALAWQAICEASGWAYELIDMVTLETSRVKGNKPHPSVKSFNTHVRNYFSMFRNLDVASMTELRKAIKGKVDQVERHVKSIEKLPVVDIMAIMSRVSAIPSVQKAVEEMKAEVKLVKKAV